MSPVILPVDPEASTLKKVRNRPIPFVGLLYFAAFIDRVDVGFARRQKGHNPPASGQEIEFMDIAEWEFAYAPTTGVRRAQGRRA